MTLLQIVAHKRNMVVSQQGRRRVATCNWQMTDLKAYTPRLYPPKIDNCGIQETTVLRSVTATAMPDLNNLSTVRIIAKHKPNPLTHISFFFFLTESLETHLSIIPQQNPVAIPTSGVALFVADTPPEFPMERLYRRHTCLTRSNYLPRFPYSDCPMDRNFILQYRTYSAMYSPCVSSTPVPRTTRKRHICLFVWVQWDHISDLNCTARDSHWTRFTNER